MVILTSIGDANILGAFHKTCHQWQMTVFVISYWNPCFWLVISRFVIDFCHLSLKKGFVKRVPGAGSKVYPATLWRQIHWYSREKTGRSEENWRKLTVSIQSWFKCEHWQFSDHRYSFFKRFPFWKTLLQCSLKQRNTFELCLNVYQSNQWSKIHHFLTHTRPNISFQSIVFS